uniref:Uncharacterized protein n=1 Tax=Anopheles coluzzii TaxID=1518534 RepID=A0A8W7PQ56_ANOCL
MQSFSCGIFPEFADLYTPICETASSVPSWIEGDPFITNNRAKYSGQPRAISSTWRLTMARTCCLAVLCPFAVMPWLLSRFTASRFSCGDIRMHGVTPNTSAVIWLNSRSSAAGAVTVSLGRNTSLRTRSVQVTRLYVRQAAAGAFSDGFICTGRTGAGGSAIAPSSSFSLYTEPIMRRVSSSLAGVRSGRSDLALDERTEWPAVTCSSRWRISLLSFSLPTLFGAGRSAPMSKLRLAIRAAPPGCWPPPPAPLPPASASRAACSCSFWSISNSSHSTPFGEPIGESRLLLLCCDCGVVLRLLWRVILNWMNVSSVSVLAVTPCGGGQRHLPMRTVFARPYGSRNGRTSNGSFSSSGGGSGGGGGGGIRLDEDESLRLRSMSEKEVDVAGGPIGRSVESLRPPALALILRMGECCTEVGEPVAPPCFGEAAPGLAGDEEEDGPAPSCCRLQGLVLGHQLLLDLDVLGHRGLEKGALHLLLAVLSTPGGMVNTGMTTSGLTEPIMSSEPDELTGGDSGAIGFGALGVNPFEVAFFAWWVVPPCVALASTADCSRSVSERSVRTVASSSLTNCAPPRMLAARERASDSSSSDPSSTGLNRSSRNWSTSDACDGTRTRRT